MAAGELGPPSQVRSDLESKLAVLRLGSRSQLSLMGALVQAKITGSDPSSLPANPPSPPP